MRIGVVSDSPALTTGYGIVTDQCCRALLAAGHEVRCFGFKDVADNPSRQTYACRIDPIDPFERWHPKLRGFVSGGAFDVLWVYMDIYNLKEVMSALDGASLPPLSVYAIFDGLPAYRRLLALLRRFRTVMVTMDPAAELLQMEGIDVHLVVPPGVDLKLFQRLDRHTLRREAAMQDAFVVGAFGRNTERKQQPRLLLALQRLVRSGDMSDLLLYFHCARRGYWDLEDLAERWGVRAQVVFADDLTDETLGVPVRGHQPGEAARWPRIPPSFGYVERLNRGDMVVNVPHGGDVEQILVEAPACGVPVAGTDDEGIMRVALGPGMPLKAGEFTIGNAGQLLHYVAIDAIEQVIRTWKTDARERRVVAEAGHAWAAHHDWGPLRRAVVSSVVFAARGEIRQ